MSIEGRSWAIECALRNARTHIRGIEYELGEMERRAEEREVLDQDVQYLKRLANLLDRVDGDLVKYREERGRRWGS